MDVDTPIAPADYDGVRRRIRALIAEHAPPPPERQQAGMRTPEAVGEVASLQAWLLTLHRAGLSPLELATGDDPWPARVVRAELEAAKVPYKIGNPLVESAIATWGTPEQRERLLPRLRSGEDIWCQLYSEPDAGSDLASLQTRAVRDGDHYRINGQKVWTTWAQWSDYGYLLARTDTASKHAGITAFAIDMHQPGIEVRPLREMTGTSDFNEVFFTDATVPVANRLGAEGEGWTIASRSLVSERSRQGGTDRELADQVVDLVALAAHGNETALADDRSLVTLYERAQVLRLLEHTMASRAEHDRQTPADAPLLKLWFSTLNLDVAEESLRVLGAASILTEGDPRAEAQGRWQDMWLYSRAYTISAGSNEVMRNLIAERRLGMPRT